MAAADASTLYEISPTATTGRHEVAAALREHWGEAPPEILLAVHEALANSERHAGGVMRAQLQVDDDHAVLDVDDGGPGFDPSSFLAAAPDAFIERGRGLWLIGQVASGVSVERLPDGTRVRLTFNRLERGIAANGDTPARGEPGAEACRPLIRALDAPAMLVDRHLRVRETSPSLRDLFGLDDVVGMDVRTLAGSIDGFFQDPMEYTERTLWLHAHPDVASDDLFRLEDGRFLRSRSIPLRDGDGDPFGRAEVVMVAGGDTALIAAMQRALLPSAPDWDDVDVGALYHSAVSATAVGGDFYDFVSLPGGARCVVIGDVSGRGASAAAASAAVRSYLRAALDARGIASAVKDVEAAIAREFSPEDFVTLALLFEESPGIWTLLSCGHPPPLVLSGDTVTTVLAAGGALGLGIAEPRARHAMHLSDGDVVLLYTDGVLDAGYGPNRFGHDRLMQSFLDFGGLEVDEMVEAIDHRVHAFAMGHLGDDHVIVAMRVR